ncbi:hypothetical protein [Roseivivax sp. CAU 1753]
MAVSPLGANAGFVVLCILGGLWAMGFLVYGTLVLIEWSDDNWNLQREFDRVIAIAVAFVLFAGGTAVSLWAFAQTRPAPKAAKER